MLNVSRYQINFFTMNIDHVNMCVTFEFNDKSLHTKNVSK